MHRRPSYILPREDLLRIQIKDTDDVTLSEMAQVCFSSMGEVKNDLDYDDYQILYQLSRYEKQEFGSFHLTNANVSSNIFDVNPNPSPFTNTKPYRLTASMSLSAVVAVA